MDDSEDKDLETIFINLNYYRDGYFASSTWTGRTVYAVCCSTVIESLVLSTRVIKIYNITREKFGGRFSWTIDKLSDVLALLPNYYYRSEIK